MSTFPTWQHHQQGQQIYDYRSVSYLFLPFFYKKNQVEKKRRRRLSIHSNPHQMHYTKNFFLHFPGSITVSAGLIFSSVSLEFINSPRNLYIFKLFCRLIGANSTWHVAKDDFRSFFLIIGSSATSLCLEII